MRAYDLRYEPPERSYGWVAELHPTTCLVIGSVTDGERDHMQAIAGDVREKPTSVLAKILGVAATRSGAMTAGMP